MDRLQPRWNGQVRRHHGPQRRQGRIRRSESRQPRSPEQQWHRCRHSAAGKAVRHHADLHGRASPDRGRRDHVHATQHDERLFRRRGDPGPDPLQRTGSGHAGQRPAVGVAEGRQRSAAGLVRVGLGHGRPRIRLYGAERRRRYQRREPVLGHEPAQNMRRHHEKRRNHHGNRRRHYGAAELPRNVGPGGARDRGAAGHRRRHAVSAGKRRQLRGGRNRHGPPDLRRSGRRDGETLRLPERRRRRQESRLRVGLGQREPRLRLHGGRRRTSTPTG